MSGCQQQLNEIQCGRNRNVYIGRRSDVALFFFEIGGANSGDLNAAVGSAIV